MKTKNFILTILLVGLSFVGSAQAPGTKVYPPFVSPNQSVFPVDNTFRPYVRQYINTPDAVGGLDSIPLYLDANALDVFVQPSDSLADSVVYYFPSQLQIPALNGAFQNTSTLAYYNKQTGQLFSTINFVVQCNNAATKTKVKFRNKYVSGFIFSTAADSTVALTSKQRLYMTFKNIDGQHFMETGKVVKFIPCMWDYQFDPNDVHTLAWRERNSQY
jgi:hypothetical protein